MCANRVEELESRVTELEASVEGLTDELLECKVRIRELENAVDEDLGFAPEPAIEPLESDDESDVADRSKPEAPDDGDKAEDPDAEIIVA